MLQFLRKSSQGGNGDGKKHSSRKQSTAKDDTILDESFADDNLDNKESHSRLSRNLRDIISNKNCLSYFVQFLETKNALSLIKFYIDAENFKKAADLCFTTKFLAKAPENISTSRTTNADETDCVRLRLGAQPQLTGAINCIDSQARQQNQLTVSRDSMTLERLDSLSVTSLDGVSDRLSISSQSEYNLRDIAETPETPEADGCEDKSVPELKSLCDLRRPLTDDEKFRIYAETSKQNPSLPVINDKKLDKAIASIATDAIRIYKKYLITNSDDFIDIPATSLSSILLALGTQQRGDDDRNDKLMSSTIFEDAQKYIYEQLEKLYFNEFLDSAFYCRYTIDVLSDETITLSDILHSEVALFYFMEYLEQESKRDYLEFWMAATNFTKHYEKNCVDFNQKEAQNDAMILYEKYFSLQAPCPLKVSDNIRSYVEERICTDMDAVRKCFHLPIRIIERYLEDRYLSGFLASQLFSNYLNELRSKVKDHKTPQWKSSMKNRRHRKTLSDCTGESTKGITRNKFMSQHNTLLAMESPKTKTTTSTSKTADMHIDLRQLSDPDLLWRRNSTSGLTFGRVDALGRYERDFELGTVTAEDKWSLSAGGNKIRSAVRKLVNLPEDKVQEEIAWQVAEMIVKDITSVTLNNKDEDDGSG